VSTGTQVQARPETTRSVRRPRIPLLFAGLMVGLFLSELNETIFSTAMPTVVGELNGLDHMLWVSTAYILAATITMPIYGKLSDLIGRKRLFIAALVIFLVGSVIGGLATSMPVLITGRAVQGLGGGGLLILVQAIVADVIPARERPRYLSIIGAVFALSAILGPVLGGWFTESVSWRWAFWFNLPLGVIAIGCAAALLRLPKADTAPIKIDTWGIITMALAVTSVVLLASWAGVQYAWSSPVIIGLAVSFVVAAVAFVVVERRVAEPLIPLRLFRNRNFTLATIAGLVMAVAMFGTIGYLPTYLQMVAGLSATGSGLMMLTLIGGLGLTTVLSGQLVSRTGRYRWLPVVGSVAVAVALALLSTLDVDTDLAVTGVYLTLFGAGIGCALQILLLIVQNAVPADQLGTATAANNFFREIGVSLGSAIVGTIFTSQLVTLLRERLPADSTGLDINALTPERLRGLGEPIQSAIASSYNAALTPVFLLLVPLLILSAVGLALIRPVPLATEVAQPDLVEVSE